MTIQVTIDPKGDINIKTSGFQANSCLDATRFLEKALGLKSSDTPTEEYYATQQLTQKAKQ